MTDVRSQLQGLSWVKNVFVSADRTDCTHICDLAIGHVDMEREIDVLDEYPLDIVGISKYGDYGLRVFIRIHDNHSSRVQ
jgi:hypothetical protein